MPRSSAGTSAGRPGRPDRPDRRAHASARQAAADADEGDAPVLREARRRRRRRLLLALSVVALVLLWTGLVFWQTYAPGVAQLHEIVRRDLLAHGGTYATLDEVAPSMALSVVAAEDRTFRTNPGVSLRGLGRSLLVDVATLDYAEGGSTITQQLVKRTLLSDEKTLRRKAKEIVLALIVARRYTKDEILEMYLNDVYFGEGAYGVAAASEAYFAKPPASLTLAQSAVLAGILQGPSRFDPFCNLEGARTRQRYVLEQLEEMGAITQAEHEAALAAPLYLIPRGCPAGGGGG